YRVRRQTARAAGEGRDPLARDDAGTGRRRDRTVPGAPSAHPDAALDRSPVYLGRAVVPRLDGSPSASHLRLSAPENPQSESPHYWQNLGQNEDNRLVSAKRGARDDTRTAQFARTAG